MYFYASLYGEYFYMYFLQYTLILKTVVDILLEGQSPLNIVGLYLAHSIKDIRGPCKCDPL